MVFDPVLLYLSYRVDVENRHEDVLVLLKELLEVRLFPDGTELEEFEHLESGQGSADHLSSMG